jgi:hypothetical protein
MKFPIRSSLLMGAALLAVAYTMAPQPARADQSQGWYVGGGVGEYNTYLYEMTGEPYGTGIPDFGFHSTAFQVFGGWRFSPYIALEGAYINLGSYQPRYGQQPFHTHSQGFAPWLVGTLPLWQPRSSAWGPIELFAKVGQYFYRYQSDFGFYAPPFDHYYNDFVYGAGIGTVIASRFEVRAEADKLNLTNTYDAYAWWVTLGYRL